ncbi:hypothetical protein FHS23_004184 [Prauserella isguenensis]|uniref:Uncharacterized protein n=1 Tax=Prauserella isguenensis TaxID=1470180 RepID=A0A839S4W0_9PSEU|nr:hypothetical protein [Prauserella isguenensis]
MHANGRYTIADLTELFIIPTLDLLVGFQSWSLTGSGDDVLLGQ